MKFNYPTHLRRRKRSWLNVFARWASKKTFDFIIEKAFSKLAMLTFTTTNERLICSLADC